MEKHLLPTETIGDVIIKNDHFAGRRRRLIAVAAAVRIPRIDQTEKIVEIMEAVEIALKENPKLFTQRVEDIRIPHHKKILAIVLHFP